MAGKILFVPLVFLSICVQAEAADTRRECPQWARRGECQRNPRYMLQNCKYSCQAVQGGKGRKKTLLSFSAAAAGVGGCGDRAQRCAYLRGYCGEKNIRNLCPRTCGACSLVRLSIKSSAQEGMQDGRYECPDWARKGECTRNPAYMLQHCRKSCKVKDIDQKRECPGWARNGECTKNAAYMQMFCKKSCKDATTSCRDTSPRCQTMRHACNQNHVRLACPKTCRTCGVTRSSSDDETSKLCSDKSTSCPGWALQGRCHINSNFMLKTCQRSCLCCSDSHNFCSYWLKRYGCGNVGVRFNCKKSCRTCGVITVMRKTNKENPALKTKAPIEEVSTRKASYTKMPEPPTITEPTELPVMTNEPTPSISNNHDTNQKICGSRYILQMMVGGRRANVAEWPWMVGIALAKSPAKVFCGGAIIANQYILTAAHCWARFPDLKPKDFLIRISDLSLRQKDVGEQIVSAVSITRHPDFKLTTYDNDISIIKLAIPLNYTRTARPICLPDQSETLLPEETLCQSAGWGLLQEDGAQAEYLQVAKLPLANKELCRQQYAKVKNVITENMFCAGDAQGEVDACQGDSGAPLFCLTSNGKFEQLGIVSWGKGCARKGFHGVYTKVSNYRTWIDATLKQLSQV